MDRDHSRSRRTRSARGLTNSWRFAVLAATLTMVAVGSAGLDCDWRQVKRNFFGSNFTLSLNIPLGLDGSAGILNPGGVGAGGDGGTPTPPTGGGGTSDDDTTTPPIPPPTPNPNPNPAPIVGGGGL